VNYSETLQFLFEQLPMFHRVGPAAYKPGLDNTIALLKSVGNPHIGLKCIHVAGTNGKGSTSHLLASILQSNGYKVGLYTSPHLKDFRERIRINGQMIREDDVVDFVKRNAPLWKNIQPSFFEITVAMCFEYFKMQAVDVAVIETGLGGRLDSTNVIQPDLSVITNVSLDHMNLLGDTVAQIAREKAGIIKPQTPVVLGPMVVDARQVMLETAANVEAPVYIADDANIEIFDDCPLKGLYQQQNFKTVAKSIEVLQTLGYQLKEYAIRQGIELVNQQTGLMGRWQILNDAPLTVADVAHNEDGIQQVMQQIANCQYQNLHFVLGMVADKDVSLVLQHLPKNAIYYFCKAQIPRGMEASILRTHANKLGLNGAVYTSIQEAFQAAQNAASQDDMIFVGGSIFTVAEVL
jgi:dihydrofolate synthase / folylpolyglutamate synthase